MQYIPPLAPGDRLPSRKGTIACILLAGMLSMLCAEVFSGSSVFWILQPLGWLFTFPLYLSHLLFFLNLAFLFRRISLPSLYFWGLLCALYETWITKVAWAGYMGQSPAVNTVLGFAPVEFAIIILFWHPVMSFIVPVLLFETLSLSSSGDNPVLSGHVSLLKKTRLHIAACCGVALIGASFLSMNSGFNLLSSLVTLLGTVLFVTVLLFATRRWNGWQFSVFSLSLGKRGFSLLILYLALLYVIAFFLLLPERIAPGFTLFFTLTIYVLVAFILWRDQPKEDLVERKATGDRVIDQADLLKCLAVMLILIMAFCLLNTHVYPLITLLYLVLVVSGPVIAILALKKVVWDNRMKGY